MPDLYSRASMLCCTSAFEGFPNTFLEAWSYGLPIVSTVDPDGLIARHELGKIAHDQSSLSSAIRLLSKNHAMFSRVSANARRHFRENYSLDAAMGRFESLFLNTIANNQRLSDATG
jgi:glycosyltransferase involved in cell wall biosynthesis